MELLGFYQPWDLEQAKTLLSEGKKAKILAGGTDLIISMHKKGVIPEYLIDLSQVSELKNIEEEKNYISIGSMVTFTQMKENRLIGAHYNSVYECAKHMGSPQVRNTATIGGNIVNAGSAADIIPCIMAHEGILVIESKGKNRKISCRDYFQHYSEEKVKEDELLTKILLPIKEGTSGYYKLGKRNSLAIARLNAALTLKLEGDVVKEMTVALGAVGRYPFRSNNLENFAIGKHIIDLTSAEALKLLEEEVMESIKGRKTMPFKKEAVKGVYKEALRIALSIYEN